MPRPDLSKYIARARAEALNMPITLISKDEDTKELSGPTTIVREERVTPEAFIDLAERDPGSIKSVRINPGRLGAQPFGEIIVEYSVPRLRRKLFSTGRKK